jgi:predicted acyl esterase
MKKEEEEEEEEEDEDEEEKAMNWRLHNRESKRTDGNRHHQQRVDCIWQHTHRHAQIAKITVAQIKYHGILMGIRNEAVKNVSSSSPSWDSPRPIFTTMGLTGGKSLDRPAGIREDGTPLYTFGEKNLYERQFD